MSRYYSYINTAKQILGAYDGNVPFASFIRTYFSQHKKYGSKDRKMITHLCYCYFRLGGLIQHAAVEEKILAALFLCSSESNDVLQLLKPEWNEQVQLSIADKLRLAGINSTNDLFPFVHELSSGIDAVAFSISHLIQPDLFLRSRPGKKEQVMKHLQTAGLSFQLLNDDCIALPNGTKVETIIELNKDAVVQDYSSQRVGEFLKMVKPSDSNLKLSVWDCCAASGGKSIMTKDILREIELTVSDVRESILQNLKKRFAEAGINNYKSFVSDLTTNDNRLPANDYQLIIADVPCSGSGTWGRTPEYLSFFKKEQIDTYSQLQKKIATNVLKQVKPGSYFLYITCSVYQKENEEVVTAIQQQCNMQLIEMKLLEGYRQKADTMFAALLKKI